MFLLVFEFIFGATVQQQNSCYLLTTFVHTYMHAYVSKIVFTISSIYPYMSNIRIILILDCEKPTCSKTVIWILFMASLGLGFVFLAIYMCCCGRESTYMHTHAQYIHIMFTINVCMHILHI